MPANSIVQKPQIKDAVRKMFLVAIPNKFFAECVLGRRCDYCILGSAPAFYAGCRSFGRLPLRDQPTCFPKVKNLSNSKKKKKKKKKLFPFAPLFFLRRPNVKKEPLIADVTNRPFSRTLQIIATCLTNERFLASRKGL